MTDKPSCKTCDKKRKIHTPRWAGDVELCLGDRCTITGEIVPIEVISKVGCLSHPQAREYLMADVLEVLQKKRDDKNNQYYAMFANSKSLYIHLDDAIELIKNGVEK